MDPSTPPPSAASGSAASAGAARAATARPAHWLDLLRAIWQELPGLLSDRMDLLTLELQRAGRALAQIVALLVAVAILGVTAWLALWAGIAMGLVELGLHWSLALLLVLLVNAGVAAWELRRLRGLVRLLQLPATRRHLTPRAWVPPATAAAPSPARPPVAPDGARAAGAGEQTAAQSSRSPT